MPVIINEIHITATISKQDVNPDAPLGTAEINIDKVVALAVEAVLDRLKELKED